MRIAYNAAAASGNRLLRGTEAGFAKTTERLSTGLRVNRAADDAAGLFLAEKLRAQTEGLRQAGRNAQDGISYLQTTEGALATIADQIERARELAVQAANGIYEDSDRAQIQEEIDHISAEIDRIVESTTFNGKRVFGDTGAAPLSKLGQMIESLRRSAFRGAEDLLEQHFGLTGDGATISIATIDNPAAGAPLASMGPSGSGLTLTLNLAKYDDNFALPDGGSMSSLEFDRVIAHELTHGVMYRRIAEMSAAPGLPDWFVEGSAEWIHGADARLYTELDAADATPGDGYTAADVATALNEVTWDTAAPAASREYSIGYAAVKYLDSRLVGAGTSMRALIDELESGDTLDQAITDTLGISQAAFLTEFKGAAGQAFVMGLNLTDEDVGGPGGGDGTTTVPDYALDTFQPMRNFHVNWPAGQPEGGTHLQVGANNVAEDGITLTGALISAGAIDLEAVDVTTQSGAMKSLDRLDRAVISLASTRSGIGAAQAKLERTVVHLGVMAEQMHAADSRIRDADAAATISEHVRTQLLRDSALGAIAHAHANNTRILPLIQFGAGQQGGGESGGGFALAA